MCNKPLVSVIIPIYNAEKYLARCLDSVVSQTYKNLEVILVDDGSTDGSKNICREYMKKDARVVLLEKKNGGVSSARNYGIKTASGEYVMFVDCDDAIDSRCIESCLDCATNNNGVDIIKYSYYKKTGLLRVKYNYSCPTNRRISSSDYPQKVYPFFLSSYDFSNVWTMFIKARLAKMIQFDEKICLGEDFLYSARIIAKSKTIIIMDKGLYDYNITSNSATRSFDKKKSLYDFMKTIDVFDDIAKITGCDKKDLYDRIIETAYSLLSNCALRCGKKDYDSFSLAVRGILAERYTDLDCRRLCYSGSYLMFKMKRIIKFIALKIMEI